MAALFTLGLVLYYFAALRHRGAGVPILALLLCGEYITLGVSGLIVATTGIIEPIYPPSYFAAGFLLLCILISTAGFAGFHDRDIAHIANSIRWQRHIENGLILCQLLAIAFFIPFAASSLIGDANENRLQLADKMALMGSYGIINTAAGAASQLFGASLILAFLRLSPVRDKGRNVPRAFLLILSSFSFIVYILAYVGRDGVVYWLMTAAMVYLVFRRHLAAADRKSVRSIGLVVSVLLLIPFFVITLSRFFDTGQSGVSSLFEYFGAQIHNFSDYSSIDRPITFGTQSFPILANVGCSLMGGGCESWEAIREAIFVLYLAQNKEPWLFGTFVSDLVGDFGEIGTLLLIMAFSALCFMIWPSRIRKSRITVARLLLILFLYLVPYWGVFYFRFSVANGYIVVNLAFILLVAVVQRFAPIGDRRHHGIQAGASLAHENRQPSQNPLGD